MAGAAGLIYALYQTTIWYFQGFQAGLIAFTAAVMGGIGNLQGAVLGGFIIGIIQQISDNRIGGEWTPAIVFAYLVLIMVFRPAGPARRGDAGGRMSSAGAAIRGTHVDEPHAHRARGRPAGHAVARERDRDGHVHGVRPLGPDRRARGLPREHRGSYERPWSRSSPGRSSCRSSRIGRRLHRGRHAGAGLRGYGARPQHHRRLRGAARPRLRGVLRARRAHCGLVHVGFLLQCGRRRGLLPPGRRAGLDAARHPLQLPLVLIIAVVITRSRACSSACRRCACEATTSPS